jgi:hypothetical protein
MCTNGEIPVSIEVQFYTVVIRREALDRLPDGAKKQFFATWGSGEIFREDEHLVATGFMNPRDVRSFVDEVESLGLRTRNKDGAFLDLAVVQEGFGTPFPCPWLALGWEGKSMQETQAELQSLFASGTRIICLGRRQAGIPHCWHKAFPPGSLAEVPFLKAKPELREGENYVMLPDEPTSNDMRDRGPMPPIEGSRTEAP